jgi:glycopeptide antibiotics resistance protein
MLRVSLPTLRVASVIYGLIILSAYLYPGGKMASFDDHYYLKIRGDYFFHCLVFIPFAMMFLHYARLKGKSMMKFGWLAILGGACFELLHLIIPNRSFNLFDMLANVVGVVLGLTLYNIFKKYIS